MLVILTALAGPALADDIAATETPSPADTTATTPVGQVEADVSVSTAEVLVTSAAEQEAMADEPEPTLASWIDRVPTLTTEDLKLRFPPLNVFPAGDPLDLIEWVAPAEDQRPGAEQVPLPFPLAGQASGQSRVDSGGGHPNFAVLASALALLALALARWVSRGRLKLALGTARLLALPG